MNFLHKCQSCVFIVHKCMYFSLYPIYLLKKTLLIKLLFHFIFNNFSLNLNNWETTLATKDTPCLVQGIFVVIHFIKKKIPNPY